MIDADSTRVRSRRERVAGVAVPAAMGVLTWLLALLAAGIVLRGSLSILSVVSLLLVGLLLWPLSVFAPWREGLSDRVLGWLADSRAVLAVWAVLVVLAALPFGTAYPGIVATVLEFHSRVSGFLFGAAVFYRGRLGPAAGDALFAAWQWYVRALWLYVVAYGTAGIARKLRGVLR